MRRAALVAPLLLAACSLDPFPPCEPADTGVPVAPPIVPVGLDAYRMWERLPYLRIGTRAYLGSTYDRSGGNEGADASHFLRQDEGDRSVALDVAGPGVLYFARANHWHGSPWHYGVDGVDHVVTETSTADPEHPTPGSVYVPEAALPSPLTFTWSTTKGADLSWVPIPFTSRLTLAYGRTHYGTGYFIYHRFPEEAENLSQPLEAWDEAPPDPAVLAWIGRAGEDLAPAGPGVVATRGVVDLPASGAVTAVDLRASPSPARRSSRPGSGTRRARARACSRTRRASSIPRCTRSRRRTGASARTSSCSRRASPAAGARCASGSATRRYGSPSSPAGRSRAGVERVPLLGVLVRLALIPARFAPGADGAHGSARLWQTPRPS